MPQHFQKTWEPRSTTSHLPLLLLICSLSGCYTTPPRYTLVDVRPQKDDVQISVRKYRLTYLLAAVPPFLSVDDRLWTVRLSIPQGNHELTAEGLEVQRVPIGKPVQLATELEHPLAKSVIQTMPRGPIAYNSELPDCYAIQTVHGRQFCMRAADNFRGFGTGAV